MIYISTDSYRNQHGRIDPKTVQTWAFQVSGEKRNRVYKGTLDVARKALRHDLICEGVGRVTVDVLA